VRTHTPAPDQPRKQPRTLGPGEIDTNLYRTELYVQGGEVWTLRIDSHLIAETSDPLDQEQAIAWAQSVMGEGVEFLNGLAWEPSTYWVANPWPPARGGRA
jgi:hypothetical protein